MTALKAKPQPPTTHSGLTEALIAAQLEFGDIAKTVKGARAKYAPLDSVLDSVRPILNQHGIAVFQTTGIQGEWMTVRTSLKHVGGEAIEGEYPVCALGKAPQDTGSALTYARRYALLALCGVHPTDEDDDGQKGAGVAGRAPAPPKPDSKVAEVMERTLSLCETQEDLAAWLIAHKQNMDKIDGSKRSAIRDAYSKLLRSLPSTDHGQD